MAFGVLVNSGEREATASNTSTPGVLDERYQRSLIATATAQQLDYLVSKAKRSRRHWNETAKQELTLPANATEAVADGGRTDKSRDIDRTLQALRQTMAGLSARANQVLSDYETVTCLCPSLSMDIDTKVTFASNDCKR